MRAPSSLSLRHLLLTTAMSCLVFAAMPGSTMAAFDPDTGRDESLSPTGDIRQSPEHSRPATVLPAPLAPLYPDRLVMIAPSPVIPSPAATAAPQTDIAQVNPASSALPDAALPKAESALQVTATSSPAEGYIAPPPPLSTAIAPPPQSAPAPASTSTPATLERVTVTVPVAAEPQAAPKDVVSIESTPLSAATKATLEKLPSALDKLPAKPVTRTSIQRVSPEVEAMRPKLEQEASYASAGIKITISRQKLDEPYELNRAYEALMAGESEQAVEIYQSILAVNPQNQDALFGLAATYQRAGEANKARLLYEALLKINSHHREALNNYLVLISAESPEPALYELQKLAQRNPDFSPLIAQIALLYEKLGEPGLARREMLRAIAISPENLVYKYNLAVMMDRQQQRADAIALYQLLIDASLRGESVPVPVAEIQNRLTYLQTASTTMISGS